MMWTRCLAGLSLALASAAAITCARADDPSRPGVTLTARIIKIDGSPHDLLLNQGRLYVSCFHGANLSVVETRSHRTALQVHLDAYESDTGPRGDEPGAPGRRQVHLCPPGDLIAASGKLFVGQVFSDALVVFDAATMWVVKRIPIAGEGYFAASPDGKTVYFASNAKDEFYVIDTASYRFRAVPYPAGGRGIGAAAVSPDGKRLYLGIQRGGTAPDGKLRAGGNCFLAVYDLERQRYAGTVYLAQLLPSGDSDDGIPRKLLFSADGRRLYAGMAQSLAGLYVIDAAALKVERNIAFAPSGKNKSFAWVDPVGLATYRGWLLVANRNNGELVVLDDSSSRPLARLSFADEGRGVGTVVVGGDRIYLGDEGSRAVYELSGHKLRRALRGAAPGAGSDTPLEVDLRAVGR
jgi:DNA-binding beta-propeller fold protein YncE